MILMNDFVAEPAELKSDMRSAAARVIDSGWYVLGPEVRAFEERWAEVCNVGHCVGVGNGMDAIELILRALDIGPGDEVITTPVTAFATVLAILRAGAVPVLADIDPASALLSPESVKRCLSARTRAVLLVHLYGQVRRMEEWQALTREAGIHLLEDCAQAHLSSWSGHPAGSFGTAGAYSFYPTKNLGALGDAGAVTTGYADLARKVGMLRNYGQSERYLHPLAGMNSRLDEMQAAFLLARLKWLPAFTEKRRSIAEAFRRRISNPYVRLLDAAEAPEAHAHHLFVVLCDQRKELIAHLERQGIQSLIHYPVAIHNQAPCKAIHKDPLGLSAAEYHVSACLSVPCHPQLADREVDQIIAAINAFSP